MSKGNSRDAVDSRQGNRIELNIQYPVPQSGIPQGGKYPMSKGNSRKPSRPVSPKLAQKAVLAKPPYSRQEFSMSKWNSQEPE